MNAKMIVPTVLLIGLMACKTDQCIIPALERQKVTDKKSIDVAAKLEHLPASGNVKTEFEKNVDQNFSTLPSEDTALFLFLTAIDCYLRRGEVGQEIARVLAQGVREKYLAAKKVASVGKEPRISALEQVKIREGNLGEATLQLYRNIGFRVE
jgi:hypothetical protein